MKDINTMRQISKSIEEALARAGCSKFGVKATVTLDFSNPHDVDSAFYAIMGEHPQSANVDAVARYVIDLGGVTFVIGASCIQTQCSQ